MKTRDWLFGAIATAATYGFLYYLLYSIKNAVNLYLSALILLVALFVAILCCPLVMNCDCYKRLFKK